MLVKRPIPPPPMLLPGKAGVSLGIASGPNGFPNNDPFPVGLESVLDCSLEGDIPGAAPNTLPFGLSRAAVLNKFKLGGSLARLSEIAVK